MNNTESIWSRTIKIPERPTLFDDDPNSPPIRPKVEAAVIGGGMAGLLTAHFLQKSGVDVIVLEENRIGSGQTKNTTAKITSQHHLIYDKLIKSVGEDQAHQYAAANQRAIGEYRRIIRERNIDCDFEQLPAYLYANSPNPSHSEELLLKEMEAARRLGIDAEYCTTTELPFPVSGALKFPSQAQFHPLIFLSAIAEGIPIFEQTKVLNVDNHQITVRCAAPINAEQNKASSKKIPQNEDGSAETQCQTIHAEHIIFATHYPFLNVPGYYFMRLHQERSYVIALEKAAKLNGMYLGIDPEGLSFRNSGDLLLLGGGKHRTGENSAGGQYDLLRRNAETLWPNSQEVARWSAQDCMTLDGIPYIGHYSESHPYWYVATGFGKWGMTSSMVSAMILSDLVTGRKNPYAQVFSPQRLNLSAAVKNMVDDGLQAFKGLGREFLSPPRDQVENLPAGHGGIVEYDNEKMGVYKDLDGTVYVVPPRCPHLGCQLEWNPDELSWDCPCHGSRFDYMGTRLSGPAQEGLPVATIVKQEDLPDV